MTKLITLIIIIAVLLGIFYGTHYRTAKQKQYQQDERWRAISQRASVIGYHYFQYAVVAIALLMLISLFSPALDVDVSLQQVLFIGFFFIVGGQFAELFALMYYDKNM